MVDLGSTPEAMCFGSRKANIFEAEVKVSWDGGGSAQHVILCTSNDLLLLYLRVGHICNNTELESAHRALGRWGDRQCFILKGPRARARYSTAMQSLTSALVRCVSCNPSFARPDGNVMRCVECANAMQQALADMPDSGCHFKKSGI